MGGKILIPLWLVSNHHGCQSIYSVVIPVKSTKTRGQLLRLVQNLTVYLHLYSTFFSQTSLAEWRHQKVERYSVQPLARSLASTSQSSSVSCVSSMSVGRRTPAPDLSSGGSSGKWGNSVRSSKVSMSLMWIHLSLNIWGLGIWVSCKAWGHGQFIY